MRKEGVATRMFGVGMPPAALLAAVRRSGPCIVFVFARLPVRDTRVLEEIPRQRPAPRVVVGGCGWDPDRLPPCARLVLGLGQAVDEVVTTLGL